MTIQASIRTCILALTLTIVAEASAQNDALAAPPTTADLKESRAFVRGSFAKEFSNANCNRLRRMLRDELLKKAENRKPSARHYALIDEARVMSLAAGDVFAACDCAALLAASYRVDGLRLQADMLSELAGTFRGRSLRVDIAMQRLVILKLACEAGRIELALAQAREATLATRNGGPMPPDFADLHRSVLASTFRRVAAYRDVEPARKVLAGDPKDAVANGRYGAHLCLVEQRWASGLDHLAKGLDTPLKQAAQLDQRGSDTDAGLQKIADSWWGVAASRSDQGHAARRRAANWYAQIPNDGGARRTAGATRVEQVRDELRGEVKALGLTVNGLAATRLQEAVVGIYAQKYPALLTIESSNRILAACRPTLTGDPKEEWGEVVIGDARLSSDEKRVVAAKMRILLKQKVPGALSVGDVIIVKVLGMWLADIPPRARGAAKVAIAKTIGPIVLSVDSDFAKKSMTGDTPPVGSALWMAGRAKITTLREFVTGVVATADAAAGGMRQSVRVVYTYPVRRATMTDHFRFTKPQIDSLRKTLIRLEW